MASFDLELTNKCINTVRVLSADMVEKAKSGHPGAPMGCAPIGFLLYTEIINYSCNNTKWFNRDRFILSNGHACALQYSLMHLVGFNITLDDLKSFRQLGSITPGHPENAITPGIEVSSGPLGQGISNAVGIALAEKHLSSVYNKDNYDIVDHYTYVLCGDGCLQEGISSESSSLAGHHGLGKLIVLYDDNSITIDGSTNLAFTEDVKGRYEAYGWHVQSIEDGNDITAIKKAIDTAKSETSKPSLIMVKTVIGYGSKKAGSEATHGAPLGSEDIAHIKKVFNFDPDQSFNIPSDVYNYCKECGVKRGGAEKIWNELFERYRVAYPDLAKELTRRISGELPDGWKDALPGNPAEGTKAAATRNYSGDVLNALANIMPELVGGSADLTGSNCAALKCSTVFQGKTNAVGRCIHFGVREHAMAAICNGMFAHGGIRPFCATFLTFIGYALGAVRCAALSKMPVLYIMTHDSIGLGEDGPTHQPVEVLDFLRSMPNTNVMRPADKEETKGCYIAAMQSTTTPTVLALSRQGTPYLAGTDHNKVLQGGYVVQEIKSTDNHLTKPTLIIAATGTELDLAITVANNIVSKNKYWIRIVSMVCFELFETQSLDYKKGIFLPGVPSMSIEAGTTLSWRRYIHAPYGIENSYGYSAPSPAMYEHFGFTAENLTAQAVHVINHYTSNSVPDLLNNYHFPQPKKLH